MEFSQPLYFSLGERPFFIHIRYTYKTNKSFESLKKYFKPVESDSLLHSFVKPAVEMGILPFALNRYLHEKGTIISCTRTRVKKNIYIGI